MKHVIWILLICASFYNLAFFLCYFRLYDSHKRVQKLNQVLEDKLLQMVDRMKSEKSQLTKDIATLSVRLAESKHNYSMLQKENVTGPFIAYLNNFIFRYIYLKLGFKTLMVNSDEIM